MFDHMNNGIDVSKSVNELRNYCESYIQSDMHMAHNDTRNSSLVCMFSKMQFSSYFQERCGGHVPVKLIALSKVFQLFEHSSLRNIAREFKLLRELSAVQVLKCEVLLLVKQGRNRVYNCIN